MTYAPGTVSRFFRIAIFACAAFAWLSLAADRPARQPEPKDLWGVWIGLDSDELTFTRLDLRGDFTGYCARVSPSDTSLHEHGVDVYRVNKWNLDGRNLTFALSPIGSNAESIYIKGKVGAFRLDLDVGGTTNEWHRGLVLRKELRVNGANAETKDRIKQAERQ